MKGTLIKHGKFFVVEYFGKHHKKGNYFESLPEGNYTLHVNMNMVDDNLEWFEDHLYQEVEYELGFHVSEQEDGIKFNIEEAIITELLDEKNKKMHNVMDVVIITESLHKHDMVCNLYGYRSTLIHIHSGSPGPHNNYIGTIITDEEPSDELTLTFEQIDEHVKKGNVYTILNKQTNKILNGAIIADLKIRHLDLIELSDEELLSTLIYFDLFSEKENVEIRKVLNMYSEKNNTIISKLTEVHRKRMFHEMMLEGFYPEDDDEDEWG
jgi:hypothetical protein